MAEILRVEGLTKYFATKKGTLHAVDGVSFRVEESKTLGIVGESGCGKSTLGRVILHLHERTGGRIIFQGQDISNVTAAQLKELRKDMQIIFQDPYASLNPRMSIGDIIAEPLKIYKLYPSKEERQKKVRETMDVVGLAERTYSLYPHELDGGRRQRVGIARALILNPKLVVCDEPVSALDVSIQAQILNLMMELQRERNLTYLFITHNLSVVKHISDDITVMYLGQMVEKAGASEIFAHQYHPYTKALISAIPIPDPKLEKNKALYTYDPSIHDYSQDKPELVCIGHDHYVYGSKKEIEGYKAVREQGIPVKPIKILDPNDPEQSLHHQEAEADKAAEEEFLVHPTHDTGSIWYMILSFFLPVLGLVGALLFKKFRHTRNYKQCRKGAVAGFVVLGVIVLLFLLLLWGAVA